MTVETADFISELEEDNPAGTDPFEEGDDHLRLVKKVLKQQFPNFDANPANPSISEINYLVGVTSALQDQLDALTDRNKSFQIPAAARNFQNSFWSTATDKNGASVADADDQHVLYYDEATFADYTEAPWPWGTNIVPSGRNPTDRIGLIIQKYIHDANKVAYNRVLQIADNPGDANNSMFEFYRGAFSGGEVLNDLWGRLSVAGVDTTQATSGVVTVATAKFEINEAHPGCLNCP